MAWSIPLMAATKFAVGEHRRQHVERRHGAPDLPSARSFADRYRPAMILMVDRTVK
jgi:hypothetical protein